MPGGGKHEGRTANGKPAGGDVEPYRRLIEIQKQLVEMAKQNEQAKRECDALREQIARDLNEQLRHSRSLRRRFHQSASKLLRRLPRIIFTETSLRARNHSTHGHPR